MLKYVDEWWNEDEGKECNVTQTSVFESMLSVFVLHTFHCTSWESSCLEFCFQTQKRFADIWPVLAIQAFTPPKRLGLSFFALQKSSWRTFAIVHKSLGESCSKKLQHRLSSLNEEGNPCKTPSSANFANWNHKLFVSPKKEGNMERERTESSCLLPVKCEEGEEEGEMGCGYWLLYTLPLHEPGNMYLVWQYAITYFPMNLKEKAGIDLLRSGPEGWLNIRWCLVATVW